MDSVKDLLAHSLGASHLLKPRQFSHAERSTSNEAESLLCDNCRKIDWVYLRENPLTSYTDITPHSRFFVLVRSKGCELCDLLMSEYELGETAVLNSFLFSNFSWWASATVPGASPSILLCVNANSDFVDVNRDNRIFYTPPDHLEEGVNLWKPRPLQETPDYEAAQRWLANCQNFHGPSCGHSSAPRIEGMHLIDVHDICVVAADQLIDPPWIALSYVWGDKHQCSPINITDGGRLPHNLPRTIEDAITVTQHLNYRYLWVDELCINQRDPTHCASQIKKMDQIYKGADLTIVAAAGDHKDFGLPGVSTQRMHNSVILPKRGVVFSSGPDPVIHIRGSSWWRRAWTFQEGYFSRRLLVFTDCQMSFFCQGTSWMEALCGSETLDETTIEWNTWPVRQNLWGTYTGSIYSNFSPLIHNYTNRRLSYQADALNAVAGVLHHHSQADDPVYNIIGLPYHVGIQDISLHSIDTIMGPALSWSHSDFGPQPERRHVFPTWTWAGWTDCVEWEPSPGEITASCLKNVEFENSTGKLFGSPELNSCKSGPDLQQMLDSVQVVVFEAPTIPSWLIKSPREHEGSGHSIMIAGHGVDGWDLATANADDLVANVEQGVWTCFCLTKAESRIFILVVRWVDEHTAERITGFSLWKHQRTEEEVQRFEDCLGEMRSVRLI